MSKPILAVDCDITVCPSDVGWYEYLHYFAGFNKQMATPYPVPYDLSELFPSVADPYNYWRTLDYSQFEPLEGSVEKLKELSEHFDIFFLSASKGSHGKSKYYWLKEHFPFCSGVMLTKEKWGMNKSVVGIIDDRMDMLQGFDYSKRILFSSPYTQTVDCSVKHVITSWLDLDVNELVKEINSV
jgi:5'(3')-deoxyribonucleotidase